MTADSSQLDLFRQATDGAKYDAVDTVTHEIERCLKCGLCRSVCPVFAEVLDESGSARGKIALIEALAIIPPFIDSDTITNH